jgi:hypothetical protein
MNKRKMKMQMPYLYTIFMDYKPGYITYVEGEKKSIKWIK